jgi:Protein of unknown function (DUF2589)
VTRAVEELAQIPFSHLIGAPLKAAVESQALAAQSTIEFIQKVGFKQSSQAPADLLFNNPNGEANAGEIRNVTFKYTKRDQNQQDNSFSLTVPLLTIVPIPYIRIDEVNITFSCKLTDQVERNTSQNSSFQLNSSVTGGYSAWWSPIKVEVRVNATYNTASSTSERLNSTREYNMQVTVRAVQDDLPAGLAKVLSILEDSIKETAPTTATPAPVP